MSRRSVQGASSSFLPLLLLLATAVVAAEALFPLNTEGKTELSFKTAGGNVVQVTVNQIKLDTSYPYKGALFWGGDVGEPPQTVLSSVNVQEDNKTVFVPLSTYSDLGDVKAASFKSTKAGFELTFHGGNTAASYDAYLTFEDGYLKSRIVRLRELPEERWDRTSYSFPRR
jgi:hypothetical protein